MKSFFTWIVEAFHPSSNWNIQPGLQRQSILPMGSNRIGPSGPPADTAVYHKDIGLPKEFEKPKPGMLLRYGKHAKDRSEEKNVPLPTVMPKEFTIIEVEMTKYRVEKWVIRFETVTDYDVVMVVQPDGFVRTTWPNRWDDTHRTLDKSKYAGKPNF
jgi:hypothetical protein